MIYKIIPITRDFIEKSVDLNWADMLYGLEHDYINDRTVRDLALNKITVVSLSESPEMKIGIVKDSNLIVVRDLLHEYVSKLNNNNMEAC